MSSVESSGSAAERTATETRAKSGAQLERLGKRRTYLGMAARRFSQNKLAMTGLAVLIIMIIIALGAGLISRYITGFSPHEQHLINRFAGFDEKGYLLGSDNFGRDLATRLAYGARVSLGIAAGSVIIALTIGATIGLLAGFYGGIVDAIAMRFVDIVLSIPTLFLLLLITTLFHVGPVLLALVIASVSWVTLSRLVRGEVISVKSREYVEAARVVGASDRRVIFRHILPNVAPIMIVWGSLVIPALILVEASLSYLGLGVQPPTPSWGNMLSSAQSVYSHSLLMIFLPGLAIYITVFAINIMGNGLRDALDPRVTD